jgi:hypothetical protein
MTRRIKEALVLAGPLEDQANGLDRQLVTLLQADFFGGDEIRLSQFAQML